MIGTEPNKKYNNEKPLLEELMRFPYDPREDLERTKFSLDLLSLNAKPLFLFNTDSAENVARVKSWHEARLAEIDSAERGYRQRLEQAKKSGAIDASDCSEALMDLQSLTNPFEKARRDAEKEAIRQEKERKRIKKIEKDLLK